MGTVKPESSCCGCGICALACPVNAITMAADAFGYVYPMIDESRCVGCGKCEKICAFGEKSRLSPTRQAYAALGTDRALTAHSASGGVFAALAERCIREGGMAAGAVMDLDDTIRVYHLLSDRPEDLKRMQGSKYVQSEATQCFARVKTALESGRTVFFTGTPCQVAAVKQLTGDPRNLITADLICHGVPPEKMLAEFGKILEKRFFGRKLTGLCFRDRSTEKAFCARLEFGDRHVLQRSHSLSFYDDFLRGANYRESCYSCPYACSDRVGDLTMGDYWGVDKAMPQLPREKRWSCLLVNSEKGSRFLESCAGALQLYPTEPEAVREENRQLSVPSQKPPRRQQLLTLYEKGGYPAVEKEFEKNHGGSLRVWLRAMKSWLKL